MKKIILLSITLLFLIGTYAQKEDFWELLNTPDTVIFSGLEHIEGNTIVGATDKGMYISYDCGITWDSSGLYYECYYMYKAPGGLILVCTDLPWGCMV